MKPVLYVDVDDTLARKVSSKRLPVDAVVRMVRELSTRAELYCWSRGGAEYAREIAIELGVKDCFVAFLPKPDGYVDDVAINEWAGPQFHPNDVQGLTVDELLAKLKR
ncbi:MAG: hypothetical protein ACO1OB_01340 [Archangium sp.]